MPFIRLREGYQDSRVFQIPDPMPTASSFNRSPRACYACGTTWNLTAHLSTRMDGITRPGGYNLEEYATSICTTCWEEACSYIEVDYVDHTGWSDSPNWDPIANGVVYVVPFKWLEVFTRWEELLDQVFPGLDNTQKMAVFYYWVGTHPPHGRPALMAFTGEQQRAYLVRYNILHLGRCVNRHLLEEECACFYDATGRWTRVCSLCRVGTRTNPCACVRPQRWTEIWIRSPLEFSGEENKTPKRYIGVEFELADGEYRHRPRDFANAAKVLGCTIKPDGSLPTYGVELITPPARGKAFRRLMHNLDEIFKSFDCVVSSSCGGHVHVDATGFGPEDGPEPVAKLLALWAKLEPTLLAGTCSTRRRGTYCNSWDFPRRRTVSKWLREVTTHGNVSRNRGYGTHWFWHPGFVLLGDRYQTLNFCAYNTHKTLEFRHWDGTASGKEAWMRGYIGDKILSAARDWSPEKVDGLIKLKTGLDVVQAVAGKRAARYIEELQGRCDQLNDVEDPEYDEEGFVEPEQYEHDDY